MLEVAFAAMALAHPNVCVFPPGQPAQCGNPGPGASTGPPGCGPSPGGGGAPRCPSPSTGKSGPPPPLDGPQQLRVGSVVDFYSTSGESLTLCYQVGTSRVGCATSGIDWFHLLVRRGSTQYVTLRVDGEVVARLVYRNVR